MSIGYIYDKEKKILIINLEGEVSFKEVDLLYKDIMSSDEFPPDIRSIWFFNKVDFSSVDKKYMENIFEIRKNYPARGNARAAFVAEGDLAFGVTRMYEALSSFELPQNIRIFREYSMAERWLLAED